MTKEMEKTTNIEPKEVAKGFFTPGFFLAPRNFFNTNPFELMKEFTKEMDKAFEGFGLEKTVDWKPAMEVFTKEGKYFIRTELPGMTREDVKVELEGNKLIIRGERKKEHKEEKEGYYRSEVNYGEFYRSILLPEGVKFEEIEAKFNNGILEVIMPVPEAKKVEPKAKEVPIGETAKAAKV